MSTSNDSIVAGIIGRSILPISVALASYFMIPLYVNLILCIPCVDRLPPIYMYQAIQINRAEWLLGISGRLTGESLKSVGRAPKWKSRFPDRKNFPTFFQFSHSLKGFSIHLQGWDWCWP